ncbi:iron-siderophore ABC transporter substrate-binding protein [Actinomadura algeriensis]|uniref:Iron complex transport system substrate-binding protein n=1 Tax=Actinomadura algeriensis TaxID=1679523 RepID=A0ABR9JPY8_9ACTN|nr:iron-siderophore ABC transporter substrate-binding protein [Actinomadura algeriensis]MBE1532645.1 iron complex transport system substrate-binding protein [Actinomadura algeriensis]
MTARLNPLALLAATASLLLALTACGSSGDTETTGSGGAASGAFPAEVATKFGAVTVEKRPERVVALGWGDAETALALGVQPVGQSDWLAFGGDGVGPWVTQKYDESPAKIGTLEPEFEKIASLRPDLILDVKSSGDQARYDLLSKIAPTIAVPEGGDSYKTSWTKQTRMIAKALGVADEGEKLIADIDAKFAAAREEHPEFAGKTISLGSRTSGGYGGYVKGTDRVGFVEKLGFANNPKIDAAAGENFSIEIARENLGMLDADLVVMTAIGIEPTEITGDPLFESVPAVRDGRSIVFDNKDISNAFATNTPLSIGYAIDKVVPLFAEKLK